jgi:hypothetical protein
MKGKIPCFVNGSKYADLALDKIPEDMRQIHLENGKPTSDHTKANDSVGIAAYHLSTVDDDGMQVSPEVATKLRSQALDKQGLLIASKTFSIDQLSKLTSDK